MNTPPAASPPPLPELEDVLTARTALLSPTPAQVPRIGIPGAIEETPADRARREAQLRAELHATTQELRRITEERTRALEASYSPWSAVALTVVTLLGALLLAAVGAWLFDAGIAWEIGES
ncbi:MAG TPA: hypothetical protein H9870_06550 [Candidatus Corynebacterium avicola]|uniref:Uncharacterized protein n=1 Tax=Candidatus Corynebacterium avicola TaxID=2838527 RepID=A0A9D1UKQ0_9CORY|nr:hypothetical protein [Candidatus Corynebacterium avicola]